MRNPNLVIFWLVNNRLHKAGSKRGRGTKGTMHESAQQIQHKEECLKLRIGKAFGVIAFVIAILLNGCGPEMMMDKDGNVYKTVKIGNQLWMAENLRTTTFNNGTPIPPITDKTEWKNLKKPGYCFYENATDAETRNKWGALYNWYVVNTGKIAPSGWRVPTDDDWKELQNYLVTNGHNHNGSKEGNKIAKSLAGKTDWKISASVGAPGNDPESNNESGFSALAGGCRHDNGSFRSKGEHGYWWSATKGDASDAWSREISCKAEYLGSDLDYLMCGFSLRLVRDR